MASHYEIARQHRMGCLDNVIHKVVGYKRDAVSVTMGGDVYEMTYYELIQPELTSTELGGTAHSKMCT